MTCTSSTTLRRRRLAAAVLALPLALAMTGTAFATGSSTAELRIASAGSASQAADTAPADDKAAAPDKAAAKAVEVKAAAEKPADKPADKPAAGKADSKADSKPTTTGSAAGAASGQSAAAATTNTTYVNGNANSSKAERPDAPVTQSAPPSQPLSTADKNGTGANPGSTCTHAYCSNKTGVEPGNGNDSAPAKGQPCAGCVGKADNKNPKGQAPSGPVDRNAGYECDRNQGIGQMNPAHTGCTTTTVPTTPPFDQCPNMAGDQPAGTPCNNGGGNGGGGKVDVCPNMPGNQPVGTPCNDGGGNGGGGKVDVCPNMPGNQPVGTPCRGPKTPKANDKITICHATGSATNPFVVITINRKGLNGHGKHEGDIIPMPASGCPGGTSGGGTTTPGKITICHATGSATNPYVVITINRNGLNGHDKHEGDIIPMPAGGCPTAPAVLVDVCPNVAGMQTMGPCTTGGGGGGGGGGTPIGEVTPGQPAINPPAAGQPIGEVTPGQPATKPVPMGPPTVPTVVPNTALAPAIIGTVGGPATGPAATRPRALPFTGTDAALLLQLGVLLLLAGGGVAFAARRERTARVG